jgi:hypothetical protein
VATSVKAFILPGESKLTHKEYLKEYLIDNPVSLYLLFGSLRQPIDTGVYRMHHYAEAGTVGPSGW